MKLSVITRILIPACIVLFWGYMTQDLALKRIIPERVRAHSALVNPDVLAMQWRDIEEWAWIRRDGKTFGAMGLKIVGVDREEQGVKTRAGYLLTQNTTTTISVLGLTGSIEMAMAIELDPGFTVRGFAAKGQAKGKGQGAPFSIECQGFARGDRIYYRFASRQGPAPADAAPPYTYGSIDTGGRPLSLQEAVKPMKARHSTLRVGETYSFDGFNPLGAMSPQKIEVKVAARETIEYNGRDVETFRVDTTWSGVTKSAWIDEAGNTQRRELPWGYIAERAGRALAGEAYPAILEPLEIPALDKKEFIRKAEEAAKGPALAAPRTGGLLGLFLGGL